MDIQSTIQKSKETLSATLTQIWKDNTGVGAADLPALMAPNFSSVITNLIQFLNPINAMIEPIAWQGEKGYNGTKMTYPRITGYRNPGVYAGEKADGRYGNPSLDQASVNLKTRKSPVKIHNLGKRASEGYIDMIATELAQEAVAYAMDFALGYLYDNAVLNSTFTGGNADTSMGGWEHSVFQSIQSFRINAASKLDGTPTLPTDMSVFTQAFVNSMRNGGEGHRKVWIFTPEMAALLTNIAPADAFRLVQNISDKPAGSSDGTSAPFEIHLGRWPRTFMNIPILVTTFFGGGLNVGTTLDTMPAITLGQNATGGTIADSTPLFFKVQKVVRKLRFDGPSFVGRTMASAASSITPSGGSNTNQVTIAVSGDSEALWYAVFCSTTGNAQDYRLVAWLPAQTYNNVGDVSGNVTSLVIKSVTPDPVLGIPSQGVFGKMQNDVPAISKLGVNEEFALLLDLDEVQGFGTYRFLDESADKLYGFATLKDVSSSARRDYFEWLLYSYGTPLCRYERSSTLITGLRAA